MAYYNSVIVIIFRNNSVSCSPKSIPQMSSLRLFLTNVNFHIGKKTSTRESRFSAFLTRDFLVCRERVLHHVLLYKWGELYFLSC